jgi:hypothetical protein
MKKHLSIILPAAACTALLLVGCGTEPSVPTSSGPSAQTQPQADVDVLADFQGGGDYARSDDSPAELAAAVPVALTGTIEDTAPGLTVVTPPDGSDKLEIREEHAIVRVRIDHVYKSEGVDLGSKFAYVAVPLGARLTDSAGNPHGDGPSTIKPISDLQKALPSGTRVVVAAYLLPDADYGEKYLNADAGAEPGAPLLFGLAPQSFSVEDGATHSLSGWESMTYDEAVAGLQKSFN